MQSLAILRFFAPSLRAELDTTLAATAAMSTSRGKVRCSPGPGAFLPRCGSGLAWDLVRAAEQPRFSRPREFDPDLAERAKERIRAEKEGVRARVSALARRAVAVTVAASHAGSLTLRARAQRLETDPKRSMMADLGFDAEDDGGMGSDGASSEAEELAARGDGARRHTAHHTAHSPAAELIPALFLPLCLAPQRLPWAPTWTMSRRCTCRCRR